MARQPKAPAAKAAKPTPNQGKVEIDTSYIAEIARPIVERHRFLTPAMVGRLIEAAYPQQRFTAAGLRKAVADSFEVVVALPG